MRAPLGGLIPSFTNLSACFIGMTTASTSSSICFSRPPISFIEGEYEVGDSNIETHGVLFSRPFIDFHSFDT